MSVLPYVYPPSHLATLVPASSRSMPWPKNVVSEKTETRFGRGERFSLGLLRALSKVFRPAAESFIAGIMVIDFGACWLPRVGDALVRGADPYDAKHDPKLQQKQGLSKGLHWLKHELGRLNWENAREETWREVLSGPALFIWPSFLFMAARRLAYGKAVELPLHSLESLRDQYLRHLNQLPQQAGLSRMQQAWRNMLEEVFEDGRSSSNALHKHFWDGWRQQFRAALALKTSSKTGARSLDTLKQALQDKVIENNRRYFSTSRLRQYEYTLARLGNNSRLMPVSAVVDTLSRFYPLLQRVETRITQQAKPTVENITRQLVSASHRLIQQKALLSLLSIASTMGFLWRLTHWSQQNEHYPANRRLQLTPVLPESATHKNVKANRSNPFLAFQQDTYSPHFQPQEPVLPWQP